MKTLEQLKNEVLADGIIDAAEVAELQKVIYADGKVDVEEADFLFEINNGVSGKANDPGWEKLFIKAISSYLLDDENSAGEIDEFEAKWLYAKIKGDGKIDSIERNLLLSLEKNSKNFPELLSSLL